MYGLMLSLFICSCVYYFVALLDFIVMFMQLATDNPNAGGKILSLGHIFLILLNIFVTVVSSMYCFGGVRSWIS